MVPAVVDASGLIPWRVGCPLARVGGHPLDGGPQLGGAVVGERLVMTEALDRGVEGDQPAKRGGCLARLTLKTPQMTVPSGLRAAAAPVNKIWCWGR